MLSKKEGMMKILKLSKYREVILVELISDLSR